MAAASLAACTNPVQPADDGDTIQLPQRTSTGNKGGGDGSEKGSETTKSESGDPTAPGGAGSSCTSLSKKMKDPFDRSAPAGNGWIAGANGIDDMEIVQFATAPSASNVLMAHFDRRLSADSWVQPILQREVPATSCVAADFAIYFGAGALDAQASTELFYVAGADNVYVNLFRRQSGALMAAGVEGVEKLVTQTDFATDTWTHVRFEVEIGKDHGAASVSFDGGPPRRLADIPKLKPPIWIALGGYSQGKAGEHYTLYDDVTLSY